MSLITALDLTDVDCDLEDTADDEPSLGWGHSGGQSFLSGTAHRGEFGPLPLVAGVLLSGRQSDHCDVLSRLDP